MARDRRPQLRDLDAETSMGYARVGLALARSVASAVLVFFLTSQSRAQTVDVSGRYQCAQAKVRGKVIPCKAAPLILKNDGRFELRGWEGSYLANGEWGTGGEGTGGEKTRARQCSRRSVFCLIRRSGE